MSRLEDLKPKASVHGILLEVKGHAAGADVITVTRNEILYSL